MSKILIVEDDSNSRIGLSEILIEEGYEVVSVADGEAALANAGPKIDAMVTDFRLPDLTGLELIEKIRCTNPQLASIIVTAYSTHELQTLSKGQGVLACLTKPIDVEKLLGLLKEATNRTILKQEQEV